MTIRSRDVPAGITHTEPRKPRLRFLPHHVALCLLAAALALLIAINGSYPAQAASFDCAKAELPLDKLICKTPDLSKLDEQMADAYKAAGTRLTADQIGTLRDGQRQWLKLMRSNCNKTNDAIEIVISCIQSSYDTRIKDLNNTGPYLFQYVTERKEKDATTSQSGKIEKLNQILRYPQVASPLTNETRRWNESLRAKARKDFAEWLTGDMEDNPDFSYTIEINSAQTGFISTYTFISWMGATHPFYEYKFHNELLATGTDVAIEQIFKADSKWLDDLAKRAVAEIKNDEPDLPVTSDVGEGLVQDVNSWGIAPDTLTIALDLRDMFGNSRGTLDLVVPWRDLKPYLRADLPIKLNTE